MEVGNVTHIEDHNMIISRANVVVGWLAGTVDLGIVRCLDFFDHFENVAHLGRIEIGARENARVLFSVLQCNIARKSLDANC